MNTKNNKGFTLIELLVVVLIIGILAAIALPQYFKAVEKSKASEALSVLGSIAGAQQRYFLVNDTYAENFTGIDLEFIPDGETTAVTNADNFNTKNFNIKLVQGTTGEGATPACVVATRKNGGKYGQYKICKENNSGMLGCKDATGIICSSIGQWNENISCSDCA